MSPQAEKSLSLYWGGQESEILGLLKGQGKTVLNELKRHFGCESLESLARHLSRGY